MIPAHLNGGPKDDQYIVVERAPLHVAGYRPLRVPWEDPMVVSAETTWKEGLYDVRRDMFGNPVPHDLTGIVEFDWKGWRT